MASGNMSEDFDDKMKILPGDKNKLDDTKILSEDATTNYRNMSDDESDIDVSDEIESEDSMSDDSDGNMSDSDTSPVVVTDDSMSDNDVTYDRDIVTHDANVINTVTEDAVTEDANCDNMTKYYILNLVSDPSLDDEYVSVTADYNVSDVLDNSRLILPSGDSDDNIDVESKEKPESEDGIFRSRLSRIKAFFSRSMEKNSEVSMTTDSETSDANMTEKVSTEALVSENAAFMTDDGDGAMTGDVPVTDDMTADAAVTDDVFVSDDDDRDTVMLVAELEHTIDTLHHEYLAWRKKRLQSIEEIRTMADSLDGHQRNVDIAKVTGTSVGAAATVAGIVFTSLALAPVTAGSSIFIGLGIGAGVVGSAGVGTGIGAVVTKKKLERGKWERLQQIVQEDSEVTDSLKLTIQRYDHILTSVTNLIKEKEEAGAARTILQAVRGTHTLAEKITVTVLKDVIRTAASATTEAVEGGAKAALVAGRVLGGIGIALGGIALVIDIIYLVQVGRNIRSGSKCEVARRLRSVAKVLEEEMLQIDDVLTFDLSAPSSRSTSRSRSFVCDLDLDEDEGFYKEMTFGKLHIDTSVIYSEFSDDDYKHQQLILED